MALLSFAVALLICEGILRLLGWSAPVFTEPDSQLGAKLLPNAEGWWRDEGTTYLKINSAGFRDREHSKSKPPGTFRIAVLGDSYTEARQVGMEAAFSAVLEDRLRSCRLTSGKTVEVLNFGVPGYGSTQELILLRNRVWDYDPDLVLLAFCTGNDVRDNSAILSQDGPRPFLVYKNQQLVLDDSMLKAADKTFNARVRRSGLGGVVNWLTQHVRLVQLLYRIRASFTDYEIRKKRGEIEGEQKKALNDQKAPQPESSPGVVSQPSDPWQEAWRVTEGIIGLMKDEVRNRGASFAMVTLTNPIQVPPYRQPDQTPEYSYDISYADRRIKALGEKENFPVLNLAPVLSAYALQHKVYLHGFDGNLGMGHWNEAGHRQAGEAISNWLCPLIGSTQTSR